MVRFHYASTKDSDMLYAIHSPVSDEVFFLDCDGKKYVFLNVLDIDAFGELNTDDSLEAVPVGKFAQALKGIPVKEQEGRLAFLILKEYGVDKETIQVSKYFPLDIADAL